MSSETLSSSLTSLPERISTCVMVNSGNKEELYELQKSERVEGALDVDAGAWDVRCGDRTYPDVCSLLEPRTVLLTSRMGNQGGSRPK